MTAASCFSLALCVKVDWSVWTTRANLLQSVILAEESAA